MFVISKGLAEVSIIDWDARTVSKAPLPEGESFGELCALNMIFVSDITVVAKTEPVELFVINLEDMGIVLGKLETEDQESFASIKEAAAKLHARRTARWRRKPAAAARRGRRSQPLATIPGSQPVTPQTEGRDRAAARGPRRPVTLERLVFPRQPVERRPRKCASRT